MSYGYVRRQRGSLNWGAIGREMADSIKQGEAERQARKADILKQDKERAEQLINQPQGEYAEANRFISEYSEQAQNQALSDLRALKNREISEREYYNRRANLQQGTDLMFTAAKNFNANYDKAMEDIRTGKSSVLLADLKGHMEAYSNFKDHGTFIDPNTGQVNVSKLVPDGDRLVASTRTGDFIDASKLVKMSNANIENYDLDGEVNKVVDSLGTISVTTSNNEKIQVSIADIASGNLDPEVVQLYNDELTASLREYAEAIVGTNIDPSAASILADHMAVGKNGYKLSFDQLVDSDGNLLEESKKKMNEGKLIFYNEKGQLQITEEQRQEAIDFVEKKLRSSLDRKVEPDVLSKKEKADIAKERNKDKRTPTQRGRDEDLTDRYKFAYEIVTGGDAATTNISQIKVLNKDITNIYEDPDKGFVIQYKDGTDELVEYIKTKDSEGVLQNNLEETAISLMTAVVPEGEKISISEANRARDMYVQGGGKFYGRTDKNQIGERLKLDAVSTTDAFTAQGFDQGIPIDAQIVTIAKKSEQRGVPNITPWNTKLDSEGVDQFQDLLRGLINPYDKTDDRLKNATVSAADNYTFNVSLNPQIAKLLETKFQSDGAIRVNPNGSVRISMGKDDEGGSYEDRLREFMNNLLSALADEYNQGSVSKGKKTPISENK
tara:strand:+ start:925 stop:2925 length:2001 start_codon:yes stop_codon:yes gene_type:complete